MLFLKLLVFICLSMNLPIYPSHAGDSLEGSKEGEIKIDVEDKKEKEIREEPKIKERDKERKKKKSERKDKREKKDKEDKKDSKKRKKSNSSGGSEKKDEPKKKKQKRTAEDINFDDVKKELLSDSKDIEKYIKAKIHHVIDGHTKSKHRGEDSYFSTDSEDEILRLIELVISHPEAYTIWEGHEGYSRLAIKKEITQDEANNIMKLNNIGKASNGNNINTVIVIFNINKKLKNEGIVMITGLATVYPSNNRYAPYSTIWKYR